MRFPLYILIGIGLWLLPLAARAQYAWQEDASQEPKRLGHGLRYRLETQASFSHDRTPLWLNANKYGLSSLEKANGYLRAAVERPLAMDSAHRWGIGYGVDLVAPLHYTSDVIVQQAFAEVRWLHGVLSVGSKEYPMELKNAMLSSGSQALGINARPVPQVRLALPEYWTIPALGRWLHLKGHIAYGIMTDQRWQWEFTRGGQDQYATRVFYQSKAGYLKIGSEERFCPWSLELGLEMGAQFGGDLYGPLDENGQREWHIKGDKGIGAFWKAFVPGGGDPGEGLYENVAGNQVGSWVARLNYDGDLFGAHLYADHYFDDHSQMFFMDYDGYGEGEEWNEKKHRRFVLYDLKDIMLGLELNFHNGTWLRDVVVEYLHTKYQSGPIYHDRTPTMSDHIAGRDDYYNHYIYPGWQHWGQVMGNPLYRSSIYNTNGSLYLENTRFVAYHLGFDGQPAARLSYRALFTYQEGWGTYKRPYTKKHHNVSFLVEGNYRLPHGWQVKAGYGMDFGHILGSNAGFQLTITKSGRL